jgi:hypothetical protein
MNRDKGSLFKQTNIAFVEPIRKTSVLKANSYQIQKDEQIEFPKWCHECFISFIEKSLENQNRNKLVFR